MTYRSLLIALAAPSILIDLMWGVEGLLEKVLIVYRFVRRCNCDGVCSNLRKLLDPPLKGTFPNS
jgi:hypothetical protein